MQKVLLLQTKITIRQVDIHRTVSNIDSVAWCLGISSWVMHTHRWLGSRHGVQENGCSLAKPRNTEPGAPVELPPSGTVHMALFVKELACKGKKWLIQQ